MNISACERNNVQLGGQGTKPMVFVHGFGCDQSVWRFITPTFEAGYKTVLLDQVGAGASVYEAYDPKRYSGLAGYAGDVVEVLRELRLEDVVLVGHSVGAMVCVLANIAAPELFSSLILVCPSPRYLNATGYEGGFQPEDIRGLLEFLDSNYVSWSQTMAPVIMGPEHGELATELAERFCRADEQIAREFARVTFESDHREDLKRVSARSLVLQCSRDLLASEAVGAFTARAIPDCEYKLLRATGHCPHLSAPGEVSGAVREFLELV